MKVPYLLSFVVFVFSCGQKQKTDKIEEVKRAYASNLVDFDYPGWPSTEDNDGSLWAGLAARAGLNVYLRAAVQPTGRVTRLPYKDSQVPSESASSVSNDMILGVISGLYYQRNLESLRAIFEYGKINSWVMGYPAYVVSRVVLKPNNIALLARTIKQLGGPDHQERLIPLVYVPLQDMDYPTHLQLVSVQLAKDLGVDNIFTEAVVQETCSYNEHDAFAMAVCGQYDKAAELLLGDYQYPAYVRGHPNYQRVHWLLAAKIVLEAH